MFNFWWSAEQSEQKMLTEMQNNEKGPLSHQKIKCSFLDYVQLLMIGWAGRWTWTPSATPLQPKSKMLILDYVQLLMIGRAGRWTQTPPATPLQQKKMKCLFLDYVQPLMIGRVIQATNSDWNAKIGPLSHHKMKCSVLDYAQLLMIIWAIGVTKFDWNVKKAPQVIIRWNAHFWITFNFLLLAEQSEQWKSTEMWQKVP